MTEHNAWLHAVAAVAAITLGIVLHISATEWCAVTICIGMVFAMEAVNTALEALCDHVSPQFAPMIKRAKDTAAAAVLITAIAALAVGLIIFIPRIL